MPTQTITIGRLNSDQGKAYAKCMRKSALIDIASWCDQAQIALALGNTAEEADAALYYDLECLLRKVAEHAA